MNGITIDVSKLHVDGTIKVKYNQQLTATNLKTYGMMGRITPNGYQSYVKDGHGDVVKMLNAQGTQVASYQYEGYGLLTSKTGAEANPFRYSGEYFDEETGFIYLRARYYNPEIMRFITEDTYVGVLTNPLSQNRYSYCEGNPVNFADPTGQWPELTSFTRSTLRNIIVNPYFVYATQQGMFEELFYAAGFTRDLSGIYHTRQDALQQYGGYNDLYDTVFHYSTLMKTDRFNFRVDDVEYSIRVWKGDYLNLGAGAELGIYTRFLSTDHWLVDTSLALPMTLTLKDIQGNQILSYSPNENQWWITGFNPYVLSVNPKELTSIYTIDFSSKTSMFYNLKKYISPEDTRWTFDEKSFMVTFTF